MAAAFFNVLAEPVQARALSAGTDPAARLHPEVIDAMREVGINLSAATPKRLTEEMAQGADLLVTMGCGDQCPYVPGLRLDDWPLDDPIGQSAERVREIRDEIRARVAALIEREGWGRSP
jgi:arsenate reductase